mmetsp:Transcript_119581/g.381563  ORF Transcript_119581/g.381563 Transcript_119581/m.381563 type:complete len:287 (+) Transcript_119581:887-1747(+)
MKLRFTHGHVSHKFRSGASIDDTIDSIRAEKKSFDDFPPMETFRLTSAALDDVDVVSSILAKFEIAEDSQEAVKLLAKLRASAGEIFSLSNRRLFVARVLKTVGVLDKVRIQEYDFNSERVQRPQRKDDDEVEQAKWLSALSTDNMGWSVDIHSGYRGFDEPGNAVHTFELPEVTTEEGASQCKRTLRNRICQKLGVERIASHMHRGVEDTFLVDVCVPANLISKVQDVDVPSGVRAKRDHVKHRLPKEQIIEFLATRSGQSMKGKGKGKSVGKGSKGSKGYPSNS